MVSRRVANAIAIAIALASTACQFVLALDGRDRIVLVPAEATPTDSGVVDAAVAFDGPSADAADASSDGGACEHQFCSTFQGDGGVLGDGWYETLGLEGSCGIGNGRTSTGGLLCSVSNAPGARFAYVRRTFAPLGPGSVTIRARGWLDRTVALTRDGQRASVLAVRLAVGSELVGQYDIVVRRVGGAESMQLLSKDQVAGADLTPIPSEWIELELAIRLDATWVEGTKAGVVTASWRGATDVLHVVAHDVLAPAQRASPAGLIPQLTAGIAYVDDGVAAAILIHFDDITFDVEP